MSFRLDTRLKQSFFICAAAVFLFQTEGLSAERKAAFLLVENVDRLIIYNKYEQMAGTTEREALLPFVPMRVLDEHAVLSDGFTKAIKVEINGNMFSLLKDSDGALVGKPALGFNRMYGNATLHLDTIQVLSNRKLSLRSISDSKSQSLSVGERLVRLFSRTKTTYVQRLSSSSPSYGWVSFPEGGENKTWRVVRPTVATAAVIPDRILQKVQSRIRHVNQTLTRLFTFFNERTQEQKSAPQWDIQKSESSIVCVLQFDSTRYLSKDLENLLLGTHFKIFSTPGRIEIRA
jgi:hypothetical protein